MRGHPIGGGSDYDDFPAADVRFANRPVWVKRFSGYPLVGVDVARRLALLFGIGTKALVWGFFSQDV